MRRPFMVSTLLLLVATLATACRHDEPVAPAAQGPSAAASIGGGDGATHRPFQGTVSGATQFVGPCAEPGAMRVNDQGTGVVTHLGSAKLEMSGCIAMTETGFTSVGEGGGQFVAANGAALHFTGVSASGDMRTGVAHARFLIQGGSGRFQTAQGEYDVVTKLLPNGAWTSTLNGWISY